MFLNTWRKTLGREPSSSRINNDTPDKINKGLIAAASPSANQINAQNSEIFAASGPNVSRRLR